MIVMAKQSVDKVVEVSVPLQGNVSNNSLRPCATAMTRKSFRPLTEKCK